ERRPGERHTWSRRCRHAWVWRSRSVGRGPRRPAVPPRRPRGTVVVSCQGPSQPRPWWRPRDGPWTGHQAALGRARPGQWSGSTSGSPGGDPRVPRARLQGTGDSKEQTMATIHLHQTTTATPEQVLAALTHFGPGRARLFSATSDEFLRVHA